MSSNIGRKLRELRGARGLTLNQLASMAGVSKSFVGDVESGRRLQPRKDYVLAVARALNVDPVFLMDDQAESVFTVFKAAGAELPKDVSEFLNSSGNALAWVRLAARLDQEEIRPESVEALITALRGLSKTVEKEN